MPIVSIIIPAYNASRFIQQCIESILSQDFYDWELIIIDDGSIDNTKKICENYSSINNKILFKSQPNQGVSVARNNGLSIASGEFIMFIDADDILPKHALRTFSEALELNPNVQLLRGEYNAIDAYGRKLFTSNKKVLNKSKFYTKKDINKFFSKYIQSEYFLWLMWIRKSSIKDTQFKEGQVYMEDARFLFSIFSNIQNCIYIPQEIYNYRKYPEATSSSLNKKKVEDIVSFSLFLNNLTTIPGALNSNTIYYAITNCWDIIFDYIVSISAEKQTQIIQQLHLRDNLKECTSNIRTVSSNMNDFINKDLNSFIKVYIKRKKFRQVINKILKLSLYLNAKLS